MDWSNRHHHHPEGPGFGGPGLRGHHPAGPGPEFRWRGGPRHGGGRRGPHPGGGRERVERGALRLLLLDTLREQPRHGYEIIKALEERSRGEYAPSAGAIYPNLQYLEDLGFVRATQEGDRRVYELTDAGRAELEAHADKVRAFWERFQAQAPSEASLHEVGFLQEELEHLSATIWNGLRGAVARDDRETIRSVRLAVQRCRDEVRGLITGQES